MLARVTKNNPKLIAWKHLRYVEKSMPTTKSVAKLYSIHYNTHNLTLHKFLYFFFFHTQPVTRSGKVDGMVSNSVYPYVTITNKTPKDQFPNYDDDDWWLDNKPNN